MGTEITVYKYRWRRLCSTLKAIVFLMGASCRNKGSASQGCLYHLLRNIGEKSQDWAFALEKQVDAMKYIYRHVTEESAQIDWLFSFISASSCSKTM